MCRNTRYATMSPSRNRNRTGMAVILSFSFLEINSLFLCFKLEYSSLRITDTTGNWFVRLVNVLDFFNNTFTFLS